MRTTERQLLTMDSNIPTHISLPPDYGPSPRVAHKDIGIVNSAFNGNCGGSHRVAATEHIQHDLQARHWELRHLLQQQWSQLLNAIIRKYEAC